MSWTEGHQQRRCRQLRGNDDLLKLEGFLEEREARLALYEFLRNNITFTTDLILGVKLFPFQHMAIKSMFETDYFLGVWARGMSKSFTTGVFAALDAVLNQGVEIGILSKSFRQAKMIFRKIEDIANKPDAVLFRQCITKTSKSNDEWLMEIGSSRIRALPLGDGEKLRGFRFHRIIIDEFALMPERIYNEVIVPFLNWKASL
jgi:phage terminase large subunit-like protein